MRSRSCATVIEPVLETISLTIATAALAQRTNQLKRRAALLKRLGQ
jgi:hypothetical protein